MKKTTFVGVLFLAAMLAASCEKGNPAAPDGPTPPDSSQYPSVPTDRIYLLDANGNPTPHMWVRLLAEPIPPRGSVITIGPSACPNGCFHNLLLECGLESLPNPITSAPFTIGFSNDGENISMHLTAVIARNGNSAQTDPGLIKVFEDKPKYMVIQAHFNGDRNGDYGTFPGESGSAKILVDYK